MKPSSKERSQRQLRVAEQIKHVLVEVLQRGKFHDEDLLDAQYLSISEVRISPDLKNATAFVFSLGGEKMDIYLPALNRIAKQLQHEIGQKLPLKFTPKLRFVGDQSFDEVSKIDDILSKIERERKAKDNG